MNVFIRQHNTNPPSSQPTAAMFELDSNDLLIYGTRHVCATGFDSTASSLACRDLGYADGSWVASTGSSVEYGASAISCEIGKTFPILD